MSIQVQSHQRTLVGFEAGVRQSFRRLSMNDPPTALVGLSAFPG